MKYCINCKFYCALSEFSIIASCSNPRCLDPVYGFPLPVRMARIEACNVDGEPKYWEKKT